MGCENVKASVPIISQSSELTCMKFCTLLRFVSVMNFTLILLSLVSIRGREPYLGDFFFIYLLILIRLTLSMLVSVLTVFNSTTIPVRTEQNIAKFCFEYC